MTSTHSGPLAEQAAQDVIHAAAAGDYALELRPGGEISRATPDWPEFAESTSVYELVTEDGRDAIAAGLAAAMANGRSDVEACLGGTDIPLVWCFERQARDTIGLALIPIPPDDPLTHAINQNVASGVVLSDRAGRIRFCNAAYGAIYGWPRARLIGQPFTSVLQPRDRERALAHHHAVIEQGASNEPVEYEIRRRDGSERVVAVQEAVIELGAGVYRLATVTDVTEHRRRERHLADMEARLRDLMDTIPGAIFQFRHTPGEGYGIDHISDGLRQIFGLSEASDLHDFSNWLQWVPEEERDAYLQSIETSRKRLLPWRHEWPIDVPAGRVWLYGASQPHQHEDGSVVWNGLVFDVTTRKQAETQLSQINTDYRHLFDHTREGIYRSTPDGRLLDVNWPLVRMHRCQDKQELLAAVADIATDWYVDPDARAQILERIQRDGHVEEFEAQIQRVGTGEHFWTSENARAVRDTNGELLYYQGTIRDITEQRRAEHFAERRGEILEMIARGEPLTYVVYEIVGTLEAYQHRLTAAVCQLHDGMLDVEAAPALSNACIHAIHRHTPDEIGEAILPAVRDGVASLDRERLDRGAPQGTLRPAMQASGYGHVMAFPVTEQEGTVVGVLAAFAAERSDLGEQMRPLLHELAQITSIALDQHRLMEKLVEQAQYDPLTRLPNRSLLSDRLLQLLREAERADRAVAVLLLDLDEFKLVNDTLGHSAGDELLTQVAARLQECLRAADTVARFGGDEFVVVVPLTAPQDATDVAERILERLQPTFRLNDRDVSALPSIGIALYPQDGTTPDNLIQAADTAMYTAKHAGKNQFRFFADSMNEQVSHRLQIETQLRRALQEQELVLHYQPRVHLADGTIYGAEALLRWQHPERGELGPAAFLATAEKSNLVCALDRYVLERGLEQLAAWQRAGHDLLLSINLSARTLSGDDFGRDIATAIERTGVDATGLELEITESMVMQDFERSTRQLRTLKQFAPGLRIALDDFGTGHSSLNYLRWLPIDTLKIDRSFIADLDTLDTADTGRAIAKTIVELGQNLNMRVIAEGVENADQAEVLRSIDCHEAQGFWYAPALPVDEFLARVGDWR